MSKGYKILGLVVINLLFIALFTFQLVNAKQEDIQDSNHESIYKTIEAGKGEYKEKGAVMNAELYFLRNDGLAIKESEGTFVEYLVTNEQVVKKGDALLSYEIPFDHIAVEEKRLSLEQNQKAYETDLRKRESEIAENRKLLQEMDLTTIEAQSFTLKITKMEISYDQFKYQSSKNINALKEDIEELELNSELKYIYAPYDGIVTTDDKITEELPLTQHMELLHIYDTKSAVLAAPAAGANKIWYNQEVSITRISNHQENKAESYKGKVASLDSVLGYKASTGMIFVMLDDPDLYETISRANIAADSVVLNNVFVLPLNVVNINNDERYIYYLDETGEIHKQYITGRDNGVEMWVYSGLSEGQRVIID